MSQNESMAPFSSDRYDARLRRRKWIKSALIVSAVAGLAWVILESASALTMF